MLETEAKVNKDQISNTQNQKPANNGNKDLPQWLVMPAIFCIGCLTGELFALFFLREAQCNKPLVQSRVFNMPMRHTEQAFFNVGDFFLSGHMKVSNREVDDTSSGKQAIGLSHNL